MREAGKQLADVQPRLQEGGDGTSSGYGHSNGRKPQESDSGKTYFVQVTHKQTRDGQRPWYGFNEVGFLWVPDTTESDLQARTVHIDDGKKARFPYNPAFHIREEELNLGDYCIARRSQRSIYCWELIFVSSGRLPEAYPYGYGNYYGGEERCVSVLRDVCITAECVDADVVITVRKYWECVVACSTEELCGPQVEEVCEE